MTLRLNPVLIWSFTECLAILMVFAQLVYGGGGFVQFENGDEGFGQKQSWGFPELQWPECPPEPAKCIEDKLNDYYLARNYVVDGQSVTLSFAFVQDMLMVTCGDNSTLDSDSFPRYKSKTNFISITIQSCEVPASYHEFLTTLNTSSVTRLDLIFNKPVTLGIKHFKNLRVNDLRIEQKGSELVYLEEGALELIHKLKTVQLERVSFPPLLLSNEIEVLTLKRGKFRGEIGSCNNLSDLYIDNWQLKDDKIPSKWMSNCTQLRYLDLHNVTVKELPADMLWNVTELEKVEMNKVILREIPKLLFRDTNKLKDLLFINNNLQELPRGIFSSLPLTTLRLDNNPLGDLCNKGNKSVIGSIPTLEDISLSNTGATRFCVEWERELPLLSQINLSGNEIQEIKFRDINWLRSKRTNLDVASNPLEAVYYTKEDYELILNEAEITVPEPNYANVYENNLILSMDAIVSCDCRTYWFALAIQDRPNHIILPEKPKCGGKRKYFNSRLQRVNATCRLPRNECSVNCECYKSVEFDKVEANCAGAGLRQLPTIKNLEKLNAAENRIDSIKELPDTLKYINLTHNQIIHLKEAEIDMLFASGNRRISIASNPLSCSCEDHQFVSALQAHKKQITDYVSVTCENNRLISTIRLSDICKLHVTTVISSIIGSLAVIVVLTGIVCYKYKREIKIFFFNKRWCLRWICEEELDCGKKYDAFVSYSHLDEEFVFKQIIQELESEENGFRLCVHCRDWIVGEWIPTQIVHSVNQSRRTLIVLSRNFLKSEWGRLEFRTAYISAMKEGRARVVVVLLEGLEVLKDVLDDELRSYLTNNTYVQWGDPLFHAKLRYALPYRSEEHKARTSGTKAVREKPLLMRKMSLNLDNQ